jgi:hypothetical protein
MRDATLNRFALDFLGTQIRLEYDHLLYQPLPSDIKLLIGMIEAGEWERKREREAILALLAADAAPVEVDWPPSPEPIPAELLDAGERERERERKRERNKRMRRPNHDASVNCG